MLVPPMSPLAKTEDEAREHTDADLAETGWIVQDRRTEILFLAPRRSSRGQVRSVPSAAASLEGTAERHEEQG